MEFKNRQKNGINGILSTNGYYAFYEFVSFQKVKIHMLYNHIF